jgi:hypothetical protein
MRPRNAGWHLTQGRYGRGLDGHLAILRSEKVVANNINSAPDSHGRRNTLMEEVLGDAFE